MELETGPHPSFSEVSLLLHIRSYSCSISAESILEFSCMKCAFFLQMTNLTSPQQTHKTSKRRISMKLEDPHTPARSTEVDPVGTTPSPIAWEGNDDDVNNVTTAMGSIWRTYQLLCSIVYCPQVSYVH